MAAALRERILQANHQSKGRKPQNDLGDAPLVEGPDAQQGGREIFSAVNHPEDIPESDRRPVGTGGRMSRREFCFGSLVGAVSAVVAAACGGPVPVPEPVPEGDKRPDSPITSGQLIAAADKITPTPTSSSTPTFTPFPSTSTVSSNTSSELLTATATPTPSLEKTPEKVVTPTPTPTPTPSSENLVEVQEINEAEVPAIGGGEAVLPTWLKEIQTKPRSQLTEAERLALAVYQLGLYCQITDKLVEIGEGSQTNYIGFKGKIRETGVNLRMEPSKLGGDATRITALNPSDGLRVFGKTQGADGLTWYLVYAEVASGQAKKSYLGYVADSLVNVDLSKGKQVSFLSSELVNLLGEILMPKKPRVISSPETGTKSILVWQADFDEGLLRYTLKKPNPPPQGWFNEGAYTITPGQDADPWPEPIFNSDGLKIGDRTVAVQALIVPDPKGRQGRVLKCEILKNTGQRETYSDGTKQEVYRAYPEVYSNIQGPFRIDLLVLIPEGPFVDLFQNTKAYNRWMSLLSFFTAENTYSGQANIRVLPNRNGNRHSITLGLYIPGFYDRDEVIQSTPFEIDKWNHISIIAKRDRTVELSLNGELISKAPLNPRHALSLARAHGGLYCGPLPPGTTVYNDKMVISRVE